MWKLHNSFIPFPYFHVQSHYFLHIYTINKPTSNVYMAHRYSGLWHDGKFITLIIKWPIWKLYRAICLQIHCSFLQWNYSGSILPTIFPNYSHSFMKLKCKCDAYHFFPCNILRFISTCLFICILIMKILLY